MTRRILAAVLLVAGSLAAQSPRPLTLAEAEKIALASHPRLQARRLLASAATQDTRQVRAGYFPTLFGSLTGAGAPTNTRLAAGGLNNPIILSRLASGVTVSQLLTDFGRTSDLVESSRLHALAQQDEAEVTQDQVLLAVDRAYFRALRSESVLRVAEQTVAARQIVVDQVRALAESKLKSGLDVSFAEVNLSEARLLLVSAQNDLEGAFAELAAALGNPRPERYLLDNEPLPPAPPDQFSELVDTALQKRPELASLRADRDSALRLAHAEKRLWLPSISAVTSLGVIPAHDTALRDSFAAAGVNISIPIFNGYLFSARKAAADLRAQAVEQSLRDQELGVVRDLRLAWLEARTAFDRIQLTDQLLNQAGQAMELAQARYDIGLSSIVELTQAQLNKTSAEIAGASARYDFQIRRATLDFASGARP